jgi:hypothetical protein
MKRPHSRSKAEQEKADCDRIAKLEEKISVMEICRHRKYSGRTAAARTAGERPAGQGSPSPARG